MAKRYRPVARDQAFLLPPDMRDWLPSGHPVWLVISAVEDHLDTRAFRAAGKPGPAGAPGFDPDMLLAVLVWAYARGVTSSRRIEELCRTDVAFMVICGRDVPDHVTIARFRARFPAVIEGFFGQVLGLCAALGMGKLGVIALDGTKIAASASRSANRTEGSLRKIAAGAVAAHAAADAAEDGLPGAGRRGDEVPAEAADPRTRSQRIGAALRAARAAEALADLEAARGEAEAAREREDARGRAYAGGVAAGTPRAGRPPAAGQASAAQARLDRAVAAQQARIGDWQRRNAGKLAATGKGLTGCPPRPPGESARVAAARASLGKAEAAQSRRAARTAAQRPPVANLTDPGSRLMTTASGGSIQGYNAQNVATADGLIIATELTADPADTGSFTPMLARAAGAAALITARRPPARPGQDAGDDPGGQIGLVLADAGYLSEDNLKADGPDRLIATGKHRNMGKAARGDTTATAFTSPLIKAMAARLAAGDGITAYRQRGHIAETPHARIKQNMRFRQLSLRGKAKASAEWQFACAVHNLFKAITAGHLTAPALTGLARQPG